MTGNSLEGAVQTQTHFTLAIDNIIRQQGKDSTLLNLPGSFRSIPPTSPQPIVHSVYCVDEFGMLVHITYDEESKKLTEVRRYESLLNMEQDLNDERMREALLPMREDIERVLSGYTPGSNIGINYRIPEGVVGYKKLPVKAIHFLDRINNKIF